MSIRLPFKPIFNIDYDQELLSTVNQQVDKYVLMLQDLLDNQHSQISSDIADSLLIFLEQPDLQSDLARFFLSLYFMERSFIKATTSCIIDLFVETSTDNFLTILQTLINNWPNDKIPLITTFKVTKGLDTQNIYQLTDIFFRWIDSNIPNSKKHEFKMFEESFNKNFLISNAESLLTELNLAAKKKYILQDTTKSFTKLIRDVISNINNNKLSILIGEPSSLDLNFVLLTIGKELFQQGKKILLNEIDYFDFPFLEILGQCYIAFLSNSLQYKGENAQYELISSLRNTPSIIVLSEDSWSKFEKMNIFSNEIYSFRVVNKNLAVSDEKEYLNLFINNYIDKMQIKIDTLEKNGLIDFILKNSYCTLNYIDKFLTNFHTFVTTDYNIKNNDLFPKSDLELEILLFKFIFVDNPNNKFIFLTLLGLKNIQNKIQTRYFTKEQIFNFQNLIYDELKKSETIEVKFNDILNFLIKNGSNLYSLESTWYETILDDPYTHFNDEQSDNIQVKKLLLIAQNFITALPVPDYEKLFIQVLLNNIEKSFSYLLDLQYLFSITPEFDKYLDTIHYTTENLKTYLNKNKPDETGYVRTAYLGSNEYFFYKIEYLIDYYIVNKLYTVSRSILSYFELSYEYLDDEHKIRYHFSVARQFIAEGSLESAYQELEKTILLFRRTKSYFISGVVLRLLGEIYFINKQPVFGNYAFDQVLQISSRLLPERSRFKAYTLLKLSDRLNEIGLFGNALANLEETLNIFQEQSLLLEELNVKQKLADILYKLGSTDLAIHELTSAINKIGDLDQSYVNQIDSIKQAFKNPELIHPLYSYKNWLKINYINSDSLEMQLDKYERKFDEFREKEINEDVLPQIIHLLRIYFKLGKITKLKLVMDYIERNIPPSLKNRGLIYLELSLLHNYLGNIDIGNYYSDLARNALYILPVDFEISSIFQINYLAYQLYLRNYEYAELLLQDHFLRKKRKQEAILYLFYAYLEGKKQESNSFEKFYEKGRSLLLEKSDVSVNKSEIKNYGEYLLLNQYENIFPVIGLHKSELIPINKINNCFYKATIDASRNNFSDSLQNILKVSELIKNLTAVEWKNDLQLYYYKRLGQIYYSDNSDSVNQKKAIHYWQEALRIITNLNKEIPQLYLFEKLDLFYLIGKNSYKFSLLDLTESNKYLISGKNLLSRFNVRNRTRLEFQFDTALGQNYFDAKDFKNAEKYFSRALEKHENKLYMELGSVLRNLGQIYFDMKETEKLESFVDKYSKYFLIFGIKEEIENLLGKRS